MSEEFEEAQRVWAQRALRDLFPKMQGSDVVVSLVPKEGDVKLWTELGLAIMLDKPIILVMIQGMLPNKKMKLVADEIVYWASAEDPEGQEDLRKAMERVTEKLL